MRVAQLPLTKEKRPLRGFASGLSGKPSRLLTVYAASSCRRSILKGGLDAAYCPVGIACITGEYVDVGRFACYDVFGIAFANGQQEVPTKESARKKQNPDRSAGIVLCGNGLSRVEAGAVTELSIFQIN
jgi:hypothetical protein